MNKASKALKVIECIQKVIGKSSYENNIPLHEPFFKNTNAFEYTKNCIDSGWVSSNGKWVKAFEEEISQYTNSKHTIALSNGTDALRLALHCVGVSHGDEVILPPFTFVATANAVAHLGAIPNFLDIEENNLGLSPEILEENLQKIVIQRENCSYNKFTGNKISAIIAVHVFGFPARILDLKKISDKWGIPLIEDSAEALGSWTLSKSNKTHCGLIGDAGILSFNGNKIITTGGGGALITNNSNIAKKARHLSTTAKLSHPWEFLHDEIGWNDRLPNINAALGVSQLEVLEERLELKRKNVHVMVASPGYVHSNFRKNTLKSDGKKEGASSRDHARMMSPEIVANKVFDGYSSKKRDLIFTVRGKLAHLIKNWFPKLADYLAYKEILNEKESLLKNY